MTYSIVAYDPARNELGVAVQTHPASVGAWVPWLRPGVGAIATQASTNVSFGPLGLELLAGGLNAQQVLAALLASDARSATRQVALVDRHGNLAVHTGERCIPFAEHYVGKHYTVQANMMLNSTVIPAMVGAFEANEGSLMQRMLLALEAAEAEGGDIRGPGSAALMVVTANPAPAWQTQTCNLRVDSDPAPLSVLRRMVEQTNAAELEAIGYQHARAGDLAAALATFAQVRAQAPDPREFQFWQAMTLATEFDRLDDARALLHDLGKREPQWLELVRRLVPAGLIATQALADQLLEPL